MMDKQREAFEAWLKREYPNSTDGYIEWHEGASEYSLDEVQFAFKARQAAASATANHIGDVNEMVQAKPVARIKTMGGYPDDSRHELELLVKHGQLSDGQLLYTAPTAQQAQWLPIESAPRDGKPILCGWNSGVEPCVCYWCEVVDEWSGWHGYPEFDEQPTHWMPLPPEPTR